MKSREAETGTAQFDAVLEQIARKLPADEAALVEPFARRWFSQVAPEDLADRSVDDLYGAVVSHWQFVRRHRGGARLRVYNPKLEEHGWESTHTVVEIVNDDMPFLVDSIAMEVNRQGLTLHLIIHPVMRVVRDGSGRYLRLAEAGETDQGRFESIIHVEVDRRAEAGDLDALRDGLERVLGDVQVAVADWPAMQQRVIEIAKGIEDNHPPVPAEEIAETLAFLRWLLDDNIVLLGCRDYELVNANGESELHIRPGSGLGLLRERAGERVSRSFSALPAHLKATLPNLPVLLTVTKSNTRSTVHRTGYIDRFSVKVFDEQGNARAERRIIGLLASTAYSASPREIPFLRGKVAAVIERAGLMPKSHAAKALLTILERYPRDELFQISTEELFHQAMGILRLGERQRTRLFVRVDPFARFVSCLIYVPREHYTTDQRLRMQAVLMEAFNGASSDFDVQFSESTLARVLIIIRTRDSSIPPYDVYELEQRLVRATRRWEDELHRAMIEHFGEERGMALLRRYGEGFPAGYREEYSPRVAVFDVEQIEALAGDDDLGMSLYIPLEARPGRLNFKIYRVGAPVPLSQSLPMLERMGVKVIDENPSEIERQDGRCVWIHDFGLAYGAAEELDIERLRPLFHDAFLRAWRGDIESDDFNRLTLLAGLTSREIVVLRAYAKHMRQAAFTFSQAYMENTLAAHPALARQLVELFAVRFDPQQDADRGARAEALAARIEEALNAVANLDEDRILRQFLAMVQATLRTNYYQRDTDGQPKSWLSLKLDPRRIPNLPQPLPMFEISVYSPRFEGVHLRGGRVARGGVRWSDRMEDFRTEILGLVKAQIVKNVVIVPVGSKGGFVVKNPPAGDREAVLAEGIACYRQYLRGLLDLTDNLVQGQVVPPRDVVRHDDDDPYLVVAADKGTASFSDHANAIALEYGFWLGDAFASGGSAGYDHKKMGITARGAWESVKRHFRELGLDTQEQPFTVVGIGDMSGDVFGNGMLRSRKIQLVAAFDHRHVFIDPRPDPETSYVERERMFALPRSSWDDYDRALISEGGGVWPRAAKSIRLSPQAREALGIAAEALPPSELVRAILTAPVDLLYNGGIGTYIKASSETDAAVGDRANDALRVNGADLRCRVVAEGGNLGVTQLGRIEYALKGGKINTDAIDNSGGVDCSDHEVNIKILLGSVVAEGDLTGKQRNELLAAMTDEVAELVLRDNYAQTQVLSVTRSRGGALLDEQAEFIRRLSHAGRLNRKIEYLPLDEEIADRALAHIGLVTPELAVLLAYSKIELFDEVLESDVPEDPYISTALTRYFPNPLRDRFAAQIQRHPLRREIIATHVVNSMINRVGPTFVSRLHGETGEPMAAIVRAYMATREIFALVPTWREIEALDNVVPDAVQTEMILETVRLVHRGTMWFLRHRSRLADLQGTLDHFSAGATGLSAGLREFVRPAYLEVIDGVAATFVGKGVPTPLAHRIASLDELYSALDFVEVAEETGRPEATVAKIYYALGDELDLYWLGLQISALPADSRWQALARGALRLELSNQARILAADALKHCPGVEAPEDVIAAWQERNRVNVERYRHLLADVKTAGAIDMAMLSVLMRELRGMD